MRFDDDDGPADRADAELASRWSGGAGSAISATEGDELNSLLTPYTAMTAVLSSGITQYHTRAYTTPPIRPDSSPQSFFFAGTPETFIVRVSSGYRGAALDACKCNCNTWRMGLATATMKMERSLAAIHG